MKKIPVVFIGHGSPMNAIEENTFTKSWKEISSSFTKPKAILIFSAHWITE
jgi:4,5-DOPA dioxygenase extradiol